MVAKSETWRFAAQRQALGDLMSDVYRLQHNFGAFFCKCKMHKMLVGMQTSVKDFFAFCLDTRRRCGDRRCHWCWRPLRLAVIDVYKQDVCVEKELYVSLTAFCELALQHRRPFRRPSRCRSSNRCLMMKMMSRMTRQPQRDANRQFYWFRICVALPLVGAVATCEANDANIEADFWLSSATPVTYLSNCLSIAKQTLAWWRLANEQKFWVTAIVLSRFITTCHQPAR